VASQTVRILGTGQLLDLQRKLRAAGHENIRSSMQRRVRRAGEPLRSDLQQTIRGLSISRQGRAPGKRGGPSPTDRPLRASIANAIRISVITKGGGAGARVWIDKDRLPRDIRNMGSVLNTGRIRHPVFGNRRRWSQQNAAPGWWDKTVAKHTPRMQREVARVLNDVQNKLT
jgi:hypothetical protein